MNALTPQQAYNHLSPCVRLLLGMPRFGTNSIRFNNITCNIYFDLEEEGITANFGDDIIESFYWDGIQSRQGAFRDLSNWISLEFNPGAKIYYSDEKSEIPYIIQPGDLFLEGKSNLILHHIFLMDKN